VHERVSEVNRNLHGPLSFWKSGATICFMEKYLILEFKELRLVGIECPRCKSTAVIDTREDAARVPLRCACCDMEFYGGTAENPLANLVKALKGIALFDRKVTAHIAGAPLEL